jgi:enoyl-CoA hydratase/carnithine racemase
MDLKEWNSHTSSNNTKKSPMPGGFAGLSSRRGKKPVISAVHGICYGGGFEAVVNTDLIIAHAGSTFSLPETSRGVVAIAGVLPRITMLLGLQRASELALTGRVLTAREAKEWGLVNEVVEEGNVVDVALRWADKILRQSPDSVIVSRAGLRAAFGADGADGGMNKVEEGIWQELQAGENIREGLKAFVEKRDVKWVDSKL